MVKNNYINVLLISGSGIIGGLLNYIYHPIMLNYLTIEEFGVFGSLVGLFNILGVLMVGIVLFLNKEISSNIKNKEKVKYIFIESLKILGIVGFLCYILFIIGSPFLANFLNIDDNFIIIIVGLSIILSFLGASEHSTIRGLKAFKLLGITAIIGPFMKLILGFILVYMGYSIYGAIIGFIVGGIFTLLIGLIYLFNYFKDIKKIGTTRELLSDFYKNKKEILHFFLISAFFAVLMNIDVIVVKNIFDAKTAGIYSGIAILAKFLIFLLLSIETVYYGQIMEFKNKKIPIHLIKNPIILIIIISIIAIIINLFIGGFVLKILKEELGNYTYIYILTLIYYSLLAFISFFTKILVGWGKYYINYILGIISLLLLIIIYTFGNTSLINFVYSFIFIGLVGTIITSIIFIKEYKNINY